MSKQEIERRKFIKGTAAAAAAVGISGVGSVEKACAYSPEGTWICVVRPITNYGEFTEYEAEKCDTEDTFTVVGPTGIAKGDCAAPAYPECALISDDLSPVIFHPSLTKTQKSEYVKLVKRAAQVANLLTSQQSSL